MSVPLVRALRRSAAVLAAAGLTLTLSACSALTRPEEITIQAEPIPGLNAPAGAKVAQPGAVAAVPAGRPPAGPATGG